MREPSQLCPSRKHMLGAVQLPNQSRYSGIRQIKENGNPLQLSGPAQREAAAKKPCTRPAGWESKHSADKKAISGWKRTRRWR